MTANSRLLRLSGKEGTEGRGRNDIACMRACLLADVTAGCTVARAASRQPSPWTACTAVLWNCGEGGMGAEAEATETAQRKNHLCTAFKSLKSRRLSTEAWAARPDFT
ncbi:hypothetical protein AAFF_G00190790 [Aldrovandia affinis]|uniref:Uncharacterized protein n=1 Tax=Aldrovandia affinis TaxID=143900 RepID=A0AAD7W6K9_9TELE|nr:hypothetical protein AAFF_G00190790 [Aldrovandia affinis]